ncbi:MAG TPA: DUF3426 domain-containing protein [Parvibaculum sp.]
MIITCPSCSTRYPVEASSFAPSGRKVRCAKCGHSWHQAPPTDLPRRGDEGMAVDADGAVEAPSPAAEAADEALPAVIQASQKPLFRSEPKPEPEAAAESAADTAGDSEESPIVMIPAAAPVSAGRLRAHLDDVASSRRGRIFTVIGWIALVLFVAGSVFSVVQYRREIAALWPKTVPLYAAAGAPVNLRGLEFRDVAYERQSENGLPVLAVKGRVVNVSGETRKLPRLRVGLSDAHQHELYHWTFALPEQELQASQSASFTTRLSSPPVDARDLEVRFVLKGEDAQASAVAAPDASAAPAETPAPAQKP